MEKKHFTKFHFTSIVKKEVTFYLNFISFHDADEGMMMTKKRWTRSTMKNCPWWRSAETVPAKDHINLLCGHI